MEANPRRQIAVMIPEMVERHWFLQFLHNQRGSVLKALLYPARVNDFETHALRVY